MSLFRRIFYGAIIGAFIGVSFVSLMWILNAPNYYTYQQSYKLAVITLGLFGAICGWVSWK